MTLRELRDALDKMISKNKEDGSQLRNNNPVTVVLRKTTESGTIKRFFPIQSVPDYFCYLGEGVPVEYRETYMIQVLEDEEVDNPDPFLPSS